MFKCVIIITEPTPTPTTIARKALAPSIPSVRPPPILKKSLSYRKPSIIEKITLVWFDPNIYDIEKDYENFLNQLNQDDHSFIYSHLLKEVLLLTNYDYHSKKQLIDFCRLHYAYDKNELKIIDEFERDYNHLSPIWWYTRECFIYSMLNKALKTQDIAQIIRMGFFIHDLYQQIQQLHSIADNHKISTVYRGQGMLKREFKMLKKSKGGLLSFTNFLSTSTNRELSLNHARHVQNESDLIAVLFEIEIDPSIASTPFTSLDKISYFPKLKNEILFSLHSVFRIGNVLKIEDNLWQINLILTKDNDEQVKRITEYLQTKIGTGTSWFQLGTLMMELSDFDKVEKLYKTLIEITSFDNWEELACFHYELGYVYIQTNDRINAFIHFKQCLNIYLTCLTSNDSELTQIRSKIVHILQQECDLNVTLESFKDAFNIENRALNRDHLKIATLHCNIGDVLDTQRNYIQAVDNYECALEIQLSHLPRRHPLLAISYNNIGRMYHQMKNDWCALSYYQKTRELQQKSLSPNHPCLAVTHYNIAKLFERRHGYKEAVDHAAGATNLARHAFGSDHHRVQLHQDYLNQLRKKTPIGVIPNGAVYE